MPNIRRRIWRSGRTWECCKKEPPTIRSAAAFIGLTYWNWLNLFQSIVFLYALFTHNLSLYFNSTNYLKYGFLVYVSVYDKNTISLNFNFAPLVLSHFDFLLLKSIDTDEPLIRTLTIEFCLFINDSINGILMLLQAFTERLVYKIASVRVIAVID